MTAHDVDPPLNVATTVVPAGSGSFGLAALLSEIVKPDVLTVPIF